MTRLFISYSHRDEALRAELDKHLALLRRQGVLDVWSDHRIPAGGELDAHIDAALESADVIALLVSSDFVSSEYCYGIEMKRAMERHAAGEATVLPVMLRPCDVKGAPFAKLKMVPTDARPVTKWPNQDEAFLDVVQHLRRLLEFRRANEGQESVALPPASLPRRSSNLSLPREFTDQDRHDFVRSTFDYVRECFRESLAALGERNPGIQGRLLDQGAQSFGAIVFRNGSRIGGCRVRLGGMFKTEGISFSNHEETGENSLNEMLSVEADKHSLHMKPSFGRFDGSDGKRLSQEGAAEYLWSLLMDQIR